MKQAQSACGSPRAAWPSPYVVTSRAPWPARMRLSGRLSRWRCFCCQAGIVMGFRHLRTAAAVIGLLTVAETGVVRAQDNYFRTLSPAAIADLIASARPDTPVPLTIA